MGDIAVDLDFDLAEEVTTVEIEPLEHVVLDMDPDTVAIGVDTSSATVDLTGWSLPAPSQWNSQLLDDGEGSEDGVRPLPPPLPPPQNPSLSSPLGSPCWMQLPMPSSPEELPAASPPLSLEWLGDLDALPSVLEPLDLSSASALESPVLVAVARPGIDLTGSLEAPRSSDRAALLGTMMCQAHPRPQTQPEGLRQLLDPVLVGVLCGAGCSDEAFCCARSTSLDEVNMELPEPSEAWRVVWPGGVNVRLETSFQSRVVAVKPHGATLRGESWGDWLVLSESRGFVAKRRGEDVLLQPMVRNRSSPCKPQPRERMTGRMRK